MNKNKLISFIVQIAQCVSHIIYIHVYAYTRSRTDAKRSPGEKGEPKENLKEYKYKCTDEIGSRRIADVFFRDPIDIF